MVVVKGTTGNLYNLLKYIESKHKNSCEVFKRKCDSSSLEVEFPIQLHKLEPYHQNIISGLVELNYDDINLNWNFKEIEEGCFISMTAACSSGPLWANELVATKEEIEKCQNTVDNERELLIAIVLGIENRAIEIENFQLRNNDGLSMSLTLEGLKNINHITNFMQLEQYKWTSVNEFFEGLQPSVSDLHLSHYVSKKINCTLMPFQTQNIKWMMEREGHAVNAEEEICSLPTIYKKAPLLHIENEGSIVNQVTKGTISNKKEIEQLQNLSHRGGILADEMGLGKTVCVIGLIAKHPFNASDILHPQAEAKSLFFLKSTLIITPETIVKQWTLELEKHAPTLEYYVYRGRSKGDNVDVKELAKYDVVMCDYQKNTDTVSELFGQVFVSIDSLKLTEINHSLPPPERPRRKAIKYEYPQSPLVTALWFRCILDEAQMIESNASNVTKMAKRIPRWYSWAVSGTPMKNAYIDLYGVYEFLNLEKTLSSSNMFSKLIDKKNLFYNFSKNTIRRNTKKYLTNQVFIPKQYRHVVRVPFSTIEQHYYDDLWRRCRREVDFSWLESNRWKPPEEHLEIFNEIKSRLRLWLLTLRQNCIHPSVITNSRVNQNSGNRVMPLSEVLSEMNRRAQDLLDDHQYTYYKSKLKVAGMHEVMRSWDKALEIYASNIPLVNNFEQLHYTRIQKFEKSTNEEEEKRLSALKGIYQRWALLLHQFYFYAAGVSHVLESEADETMYYAKASNLREVLLEKEAERVRSSIRDVQMATSHMILDVEGYKVGARALTVDLAILKNQEDYLEMKEHYKNTIENVNNIGEVMDQQLKKLNYLKSKLLTILTKSFEDDSVVTGDEYENSLSEQEMCQIYLDAYQNLLRDRKFIVNGTTSLLHEPSKPKKDNGEYMSKEAKMVQKTEFQFRKRISSPAVGFHIECLKDIEQKLRSIKSFMVSKNKSEPTICAITKESQRIKAILPAQIKLIEILESDALKLSSLLNLRIAYYKRLQKISDTLLEWKHKKPQKEIEALENNEERLLELIARATSKNQYFRTLTEELSSNGETIQKDCMICQEPIEKGMITYCGHVSCFDCGSLWIKRTRKCHTCASKMHPYEWYTVSYKQLEIIRDDKNLGSSSEIEDANNPELLSEILKKTSNQDLYGEYGAKLDSIIRHIKYLKETNESKCVVFSQFPKVIDMLKMGLENNGIQCMTLANHSKKKVDATKFQNDPNLSVILLHSRSHSSGLTLVAAHTVFIVEPLLNQSLEKQAINRIHRIGQTQNTHVFYYIIQDTIEERIHSILSTRQNDSALSEENLKLANESEGGGEYVQEDDLRLCFTQHESFL